MISRQFLAVEFTMLFRPQSLFRPIWWSCNLLLVLALAATFYAGVWEYSVRQYLKGVSTAIIPNSASQQQKLEIILARMSAKPALPAQEPGELNSLADLLENLKDEGLFEISDTNLDYFLNLSWSAGLQSRPLYLLSKENQITRSVAEVRLEGRWIIVDPDLHAIMKDAKGNLLSRNDLQHPETSAMGPTNSLSGYLPERPYAKVTNLRIAASPHFESSLWNRLEKFLSKSEEYLHWSPPFERRSFLYLFSSIGSLLCLLSVRAVLAWMADHYLGIPRFHLLANLRHAAISFFRMPELE